MTKLKYGSLGLLCTALILPTMGAAQDDAGPAYVNVREVTTHASGGETWVAQQAKLAAAHKERGDPTRHVWQEVIGDIDTFHIVTYSDSIGGGGGEGGPPMGDATDEWVATIAPTVDSRSTRILRRVPGTTIPGGEDHEYLVVRTTYVAAGRGDEYEDWLRDKLVPGLKAGGAEGRRFSEVRFGDRRNVYIATSRIASPAALNQPGAMANLSEEERNAIFEGTEGMTWGTEVVVLRFREDLSHDGPEE